MDYYVLDGVEDGIARLESPEGGLLCLSAGQLPETVCEGDCLRKENGCYIVDEQLTAMRRERLRSLRKKLIKPEKED